MVHLLALEIRVLLFIGNSGVEVLKALDLIVLSLVESLHCFLEALLVGVLLLERRDVEGQVGLVSGKDIDKLTKRGIE